VGGALKRDYSGSINTLPYKQFSCSSDYFTTPYEPVQFMQCSMKCVGLYTVRREGLGRKRHRKRQQRTAHTNAARCLCHSWNSILLHVQGVKGRARVLRSVLQDSDKMRSLKRIKVWQGNEQKERSCWNVPLCSVARVALRWEKVTLQK